MEETKFWEFKTCIEYKLENGSHVFRCKGCHKDSPTAFNAARHANLCQKFQNDYVEDYERFRDKVQELYINRNLSIKEVSDILRINRTFMLSIINKLDIRKSQELIKHNQQVKREQTLIERYGVKNSMQSPEVKEKVKQTWIEKYGVDNPNKSKEIQEKSRKTCMERYGVDHISKTDAVKNKIKKTNLERYGVEYGLQSDSIKKKGIETSLKKYGTQHPMQSEEMKTKRKELNMQRYGVSTNLKLPETKEKIKKTNLERYGVPYHCMTDKCIQANGHIISNSNKAFADYLKNNFEINSEFEFHIGHYSYDLQITDSNTLIEINPTYTHNSTIGPIFGNHQKDPLPIDYHLNKTELAIQNGYHCIHVFDWDDWTKIINIINPNKTRIYARDCELIYDPPQKECNEFLNEYHLQGTCRGQSARIGSYYNDKLVQLMTFGTSRYNKNYQWELLRYCSHPDYIIVGGSQKLFKYFVKYFKPESVISYCDKAKFTGNVYNHLGFKLHHSTGPTPHWFNGKIHITDALLRQRGFDQLFKTDYGKGTSNEELMILHGFVKVYDCGQNAYIWINKNKNLFEVKEN